MNKEALFLTLAATAAAIPAAIAAMPAANLWEIGPNVRGRNYSIGMPARPAVGPGGSVSFEFPAQGRGQVDALTTPVQPLKGARQITMRYRIDTARGTRFVADEIPAEAASVSLYIQRAGDNWTGRGRYQSYRWYAPVRAVVPLAPGEHTLVVRLDERWTDVHGSDNIDQPRLFEEALADTERLGIAFGSRSLRSHGVFATGPARFTLLDLRID